MPKETMTSRERWLAVLNHRLPDRIPMDYWATGEATAKLCEHMGCGFEEAAQELHLDIPLTVAPAYAGPPPEPGKDIWGVAFRDVDYGTGVYREGVSAPLAEYETAGEIEANYQWPDVDWWDFSVIPAQVEGQEDRIVRGGGSEPFLQYKILRGEEQAFLDLVMRPDIVNYCLDKLFGHCYESTRRIFEAIPGRVSITYVAEDLGGQAGLMYSKEHIQEYLLPRMKRMMDLTRENGSFVFTHTDGAVRDIIPELIETGTQVLNPIQWPCPGMEREGLKRDFGDKLVFHGAVDNQHVLPFGTPDEVRREVLDDIRILGEGGGYVLAPCHNIQSVSPPQNVITMYETGYEAGWY